MKHLLVLVVIASAVYYTVAPIFEALVSEVATLVVFLSEVI